MKKVSAKTNKTTEQKTEKISKPAKKTVPFSEDVWNEIKNKETQLFGMAGKVSDFTSPILTIPEMCILTYSAQAVIRDIERVINGKYEVGQADRYIIISKKQGS